MCCSHCCLGSGRMVDTFCWRWQGMLCDERPRSWDSHGVLPALPRIRAPRGQEAFDFLLRVACTPGEGPTQVLLDCWGLCCSSPPGRKGWPHLTQDRSACFPGEETMEGGVTEPACLEVRALQSTRCIRRRVCLRFTDERPEQRSESPGGLRSCLTPRLCLQW